MKILFDENMPFAKEFFGELGELTPFAGRALNADDVSDADVLLVRSITQVDSKLLSKNTNLHFVGSATIGVDHIDQAYLGERDCPFHSAPGCNAISVAEYVLSALVVISERYLLDLYGLSVGIIGAGNTGSRLSEKLSALGIKHVLCDPLLLKQQTHQQQEKQASEGQSCDLRDYVSLEQALACDVISLHVPLTRDGQHPTYHLLDQQRLAKLTNNQILINACRGEVIDNQGLLSLKQNGHGIKLILDVWENEPNVLTPLIAFTEIATAHIAGYSLEGKARGTQMLYQALCQQLGIAPKLTLEQLLPQASISYVEIKHNVDAINLNQLVKMVYDVRRDDAIFRRTLADQGFDAIRKNYPTRREFSAVTLGVINPASDDVPSRLGFQHLSK
jgi:erythronate-4-phosphate dehydrogenase